MLYLADKPFPASELQCDCVCAGSLLTISWGLIINLHAVKLKSSQCVRLAALAKWLPNDNQKIKTNENRKNYAVKIYLQYIYCVLEWLK